jgi:hypothetical protein
MRRPSTVDAAERFTHATYGRARTARQRLRFVDIQRRTGDLARHQRRDDCTAARIVSHIATSNLH